MEIFEKLLLNIRKTKEIRVGLVLLLILILVAAFGPKIITHDPRALNDDLLHPPSREYILGTDGMGRDVFSMVIMGTRTSLKVGITAAFISGILGTLIGGISGYFGGWVDKVISEIINIFLMVPSFFLIIMIVAIYGSSLFNVILVISLTGWTGTARLMRAQAISLKERTFVKSAKTIGESDFSILFKHIIPNGIYPIIADSTMAISGAILFEASLSFLGLGDPNVMSWGKIIAHGKGYLTKGWWIATFAGLCIVFTVMAFHLIAEGINKIMNPKLSNLD